jgi:hypothetical protein
MIVPCPSTSPKMFWAGSKDDFHSLNSVFVPEQNQFGATLNAIKFLILHKKFGTSTICLF